MMASVVLVCAIFAQRIAHSTQHQQPRTETLTPTQGRRSAVERDILYKTSHTVAVRHSNY